MKFVIYCVLLSAIMASVYSTCNLGWGKRQQHDSQLHVLHAKKGPASEPVNMTLIFSYEVSPVGYEEVTYVQLYGSEADCIFDIDPNIDVKKGFSIRLSSNKPVTDLSGNATVYGFP
ncbi:uncharacterized protein LOC131432010 [Malaya genurostris]|uniref:uncharacterized protein LOC131431820 n=1 Tax=Malaya genurostris TaxID=325434 RepID=UPI0026F3E6C1|nr:uncharacterized protein LOC131431820 [Malaya genurostris]XP_058454012.1 uncharacterized protein LOC131432010 [Malaya genurostris]